jgi:hypothetical protein
MELEAISARWEEALVSVSMGENFRLGDSQFSLAFLV